MFDHKHEFGQCSSEWDRWSFNSLISVRHVPALLVGQIRTRNAALCAQTEQCYSATIWQLQSCDCTQSFDVQSYTSELFCNALLQRFFCESYSLNHFCNVECWIVHAHEHMICCYNLLHWFAAMLVCDSLYQSFNAMICCYERARARHLRHWRSPSRSASRSPMIHCWKSTTNMSLQRLNCDHYFRLGLCC